MIVIKMSDPNGFGVNESRRRFKTGSRAQRGAGNFEGNQRLCGQGASGHNQGTTGRNVYSGGKFQGIAAASIPRSDKNWYGKV
jgi:hypothetical protein